MADLTDKEYEKLNEELLEMIEDIENTIAGDKEFFNLIEPQENIRL